MKDFFVSYNKADRSWAEWIAWQLEDARYSTVIQAWDFRPGNNFILEMDQAAKESVRTVAVLSRDFLKSDFTKPEWAAAFVKDPTGKDGKLLPVRVKECQPDGLLTAIGYIDLVGLDEYSAKKALLEGVQLGRAKPTSIPIFPGAISHSTKMKPRFPGLLPSIWNVPHHRNPNFTGRGSLLNDIRSMLASTGCVVLHGLGGVGKTQLAVEYAYNNIADYEVVWWIRSEESAILTSDYAELYPVLNLPKLEGQRELVKAVRHWMGQNTDWLLIFDNANSVDFVRDYLPQGDSGHVIITSRDSTNWDSIASTLPIKGFEQGESIDFLLKRSGHIDEATADTLAEALGYLPLALEQAGAYIKTTGRSLSDYLKLFMEHQKEILKHGKPFDYPYTVATTWEISFQQLRVDSPESIDLLNLCAFLSPEDIPRDLLVNYVEHLPNSLAISLKDPISFDENVSALRRYSLVEATEDALSVHRLVQAVVRDKLEEKNRHIWAEAAIRILEDAFPYNPYNVQTWDECARLLPHALAATEHSEKLVVSQETTVSLLDDLGRYLIKRGEFYEAKSVLERALELKEKIYGKNDIEMAITLNHFSEVLRHLSELGLAKKNSEMALEICEKVYGPNHPEIAGIVNNLGLILKDLDDLEGAKRCITRALNIFQNINKQNGPEIAVMFGNLGMVLQDLGDLEGAKKNYERAIEIDKRICKPDQINFGRDVNNLAMVLKDLNELEESKKNFEKALEIYEKVYGSNHPETAIVVDNLGMVLQDLGNLEGAKNSFLKALEIAEKIYREDHPFMATVFNNLGNVLHASGDLKEAKGYLERALEIDERAYGSVHPQVAIDANNLGSVLVDLNYFEEARKAFERSLKIYERSYGLEHPYIATTLSNLGLVQKELGDLKGAKGSFERCLKISEKIYGPLHPLITITLNYLGLVQKELGDLKGAKSSFERSLKIGERIYGSISPHVAVTLSNLGVAQKRLGDLEGAKNSYEKALKIGEKIYKPGSSEMAVMLNNLFMVNQSLWRRGIS